MATKLPEINILMLGETGVGKSTFINGIANYLTFQTLEEAEINDLVSLIPIKFNVTTLIDGKYVIKKVTSGEDDNEDVEEGQSATQACRCYVFQHEEYLIRIIDTPGIGDVRGIVQDKKNIENLMSFLGQYDDLYAICILMKPNQARLTIEFQFCLRQLLCQLSKSASKNIIFVFTNSRSTFYMPGETLPLLKKNLDEIAEASQVKIPLNQNTIFCLDNEAFRFLVTMRDGFRFSHQQKQDYSASWRHSFDESTRLINTIIGDQHQPGLTPHKVQETLSVNETRQAIINLSQPLADITQNIQDNLKILEQRQQEVIDNQDNIEVLKTKLYVPELDLVVKELDHPATICAHKDCARTFQVAGLTKWHYGQPCHPHCYLDNVPREILGDPSLKNCKAMHPSGETCNQCEHSYEYHMHVYYESELVEKKSEDKRIKKQINDKESAKRAAEQMILQVEKKRRTYEREQDIITKAMAKFGYFLKTNAITPYNDSFKEYIEHLIENQKTLSGKGMNNKETIEGLESMLKQYNEEVRILNQAINMNVPYAYLHIDSNEVFKIIEQLFDLELTGNKIMQLYQTLKDARRRENYNHREVVYEPKSVIRKVGAAIANTARGVTNFFTGKTSQSQLNQNYQQNLMDIQVDNFDKKLEEMIKKKLDERSKADSFRFQEHSSFDDNPLPRRRNEDYQSAGFNRYAQTLPETSSWRLNLGRDERLLSNVIRQFYDDEMNGYQQGIRNQRQSNLNWRDYDDTRSNLSFGHWNNSYGNQQKQTVRRSDQFSEDDKWDRQTGNPYAPPMHSFGQPMGPYQQNSYGQFCNSQMPPFAGMSPQQYQQPFQMQAPGMPFRQDLNLFSPPPSYKDVKKVDEKGDVSESKSKKRNRKDENKKKNGSNKGKVKDNEKREEESEDGWKQKFEELEKKMTEMQLQLGKLVNHLTNK